MNTSITKRQKDLLSIIYHHIKESGYPPTFEEMREALHVSSNQSVVDLLNKLEAKAVIRRGESAARGILILPLGYKLLERHPMAPFVGTTTAGIPLDPIELHGDWKSVSSDAYMFSGEVFLLKIKGDSMINAGIDDGDMVLVKGEKEFSPGWIVLASVNGAFTVKRFVTQNKPPYMYLKPENPSYPIVPFHDGVELKGKVISKMAKDTWIQLQ